jgi:zinc transporter 1/2/3
MMGSLLTFICEEFVHRRVSRFAALHGHAHAHEHDHDHGHGHEHGHKHKHKHEKDKDKQEEMKEEEKKEEEKTKEGESSSSGSDVSNDSGRALEEGTISDTSTSLTPPPSPGCKRAEVPAQASNTKDLDVVVTVAEEEEAHAEHITEAQIGYYTELYVLLFGLSFHSIFVGIALGISGNDWGLFAAIIFHQFFEGLALGARVARAGFKSKFHIWLLDVVYPLLLVFYFIRAYFLFFF